MGNEVKKDSVLRRRPESWEILLGIVIIVLGVLFEYIDTIGLGLGGPTGPDVFPPPIAQWDASLLLAINPGLLSPIPSAFFGLVTHLGSTLAVVVFCIVLYWLGYRKEAVLILTTVVIGTLIVAPLKIAVMRPRPYSTLSGVIPLDYESGSSFPSGHSERIFALAAVFPTRKSMKVLLLYLLSIAVAFSRIYVGVHYPLDVLVGVLIGLVVGKVTLRLQTRILGVASRFVKL
ncbi:MAG: phosphatase PAP2 family protein [Promethearchaeati archaeon SRVP18_Atabeyarchaeia-1]